MKIWIFQAKNRDFRKIPFHIIMNLRFSNSVFYDSNLRCTTSVNTCQFWPRQLYDGWPPWNNSLKYTNRITFSGRKKWMMRFMVDFFLVLFNAFLCQNRRPKFFTRCIDFPYHFLKLHLIFTKRKISEKVWIAFVGHFCQPSIIASQG